MPNCKYCGNGFKNTGVHERYCEKNPNAQKKGATKEQPTLRPPEQPQPEKKPIIITDIQQYIIDDEDNVAWFDMGNGKKISKNPELFGIMSDEKGLEKVPVVLLQTFDGLFLPPFMFQGFIGMYPRYQEFSEGSQPDTTEPFPPFPEEEIKPIIASIEPIKSQPVHDNRTDRVIMPPGQPKVKEKKGILGFLSKKEKESPKEISKETNELLKNFTDATR